MTWVQRQLDDETLFPTQLGVAFPVDFVERVQNIFKRLFRVYAHIYYCHFEKMTSLGAEPHLNTCFKHYMYFVLEFNLIPAPQELAPLQELIDKLMSEDAERFGGQARRRRSRRRAAARRRRRHAIAVHERSVRERRGGAWPYTESIDLSHRRRYHGIGLHVHRRPHRLDADAGGAHELWSAARSAKAWLRALPVGPMRTACRAGWRHSCLRRFCTMCQRAPQQTRLGDVDQW